MRPPLARRLGRLPQDHVVAARRVALLAGIGFTVSLFVTAFDDRPARRQGRILARAGLGTVLLRWPPRPRSLVAAQLTLGDLHAVDLVGTVGEAQRPHAGVHRGQRHVVADAHAAVGLDGRSITRRAMFGTITLMAEISIRAPLLPTVSISHAAFSVSRRACSISMRQSAIHSWITPCSASVLPKVTRLLDPPAHQLQRPLGQPDHAHAVVDPAGTEPGLGDGEPAALLAEQVAGRHPHVLEVDLAVPLLVVVAEHRQRAHHVDPGGVAAGRGSSTAAGGRRRRDRSCP